MSFTNFAFTQRAFLQQEGLPFAEWLPEEAIRQIHREAGLPLPDEQANQGVICTTPVTLWAFLSQVLYANEQRSCAAAVARVIVLCVELGREPCSDDTGAYCRARAQLPLALIQRATYHVAEQAEAQVPAAWLWKRRHVHLLDGRTVSTPDTTSLQAKFPQSSSQKRAPQPAQPTNAFRRAKSIPQASRASKPDAVTTMRARDSAIRS